MKTLLIGASTNPDRYSFKAAQSLTKHGHEIVLIGLNEGIVANTAIQTGLPPLTKIDTVTLYLNSDNQKAFYQYILGLQPRRIIFNPGTENEELIHLAEAQGIETIVGCTLVMLSVGTY